jgi:hypothetical protein
MARCYQDALPALDTAFNAADANDIGIYLSIEGREKAGLKDVDNWLLGIKKLMKKYTKRHSFIGIDLINKPFMDQTLLARYWEKGYQTVRKFCKNCLIFISSR